MKKQIKIKQDDESPVPFEILAEEIVSISRGVTKLLSGRLNEDIIAILIQKACPCIGPKYGAKTKPSVVDIRAVLSGIKDLEKTCLKNTKP